MTKRQVETCSSGCLRPAENRLPWPVRTAWYLRELVTWPSTARQLKRAGFRRTGWRTWETVPEDEKLLSTALADGAHALTDGHLQEGSLDRIRARAGEEPDESEDGCGCKGPWHG